MIYDILIIFKNWKEAIVRKNSITKKTLLKVLLN